MRRETAMFSIWYILLLYRFTGRTGASPVSSASTTHSLANPTCPSRTANYLTHTLPQQCLTSSRGAISSQTANSTIATTPTVSPVTTSIGQLQEDVEVPSPTESYLATTAEVITHSSDTPRIVTTVTASAVSNQALVPALPELIDEESSLEGGGFLSFEEWKKRNLQKAGQSEHVGRDANAVPREGRSRQSSVQNSLDSFGDDVEIDLDFTGFVSGAPEGPGGQVRVPADGTGLAGSERGSKPKTVSSRNRDAGTTCKERFNYASFDCAASMLKTNPQAKSPGSVLNENKDAYMLNECSAETKHIVLELCNDILIDTVVLANFEFFSSIFRTFRVSVSDRYPVRSDKWKPLGTFEARNTREVQAFLIESPMIWARYLRIEFLSHYGSEYYCPISLVRVHGTTMLEEYKHDMAAGTADEEESEGEEVAESPEETLVPKAVDQELVQNDDIAFDEPIPEEPVPKTTVESSHERHEPMPISENSCSPADSIPNATTQSDHYIFPSLDLGICYDSEAPKSYTPNNDTGSMVYTTDAHPQKIPTTSPSAASSATTAHTSSHQNRVQSLTDQSGVGTAKPSTIAPASTSAGVVGADNSTTNATSGAQGSASADRSKPAPSVSEKPKQTSSATQSAPASPTMQESFFKSVQKRLQMLESNSSLSLQYIEEQSRTLQDAFKKVEQRQLSRTTIFLDHLNSTVLKELREFRQQYDQLWQSTVIELAMQREQYQRENQAMHARLGVLADELIFQKRVSILQMTMILVCLVLVLFSRGAINNYLELPLVQSVLSRSPRSRWMNLSGDSPSNPRQLTRARSAHQIGMKPNGILKGHRRLQSEDSNLTDTPSQSELYSPPTPVSFDGFSDASQPPRDHIKVVSDLDFDPETIERPSTSPPVLSTSNPNTPRLSDQAEFTTMENRMLTPGSSAEHLSPPRHEVRSMPTTPPLKHLTWNLPNTS